MTIRSLLLSEHALPSPRYEMEGRCCHGYSPDVPCIDGLMFMIRLLASSSSYGYVANNNSPPSHTSLIGSVILPGPAMTSKVSPNGTPSCSSLKLIICSQNLSMFTPRAVSVFSRLVELWKFKAKRLGEGEWFNCDEDLQVSRG
jgi:hypothetical protein